MRRNKVPAVSIAVELAGGLTVVAEHFGITPQAVWLWVDRGYAPASRCVGLEALCGRAVTRYELRTDIFGRG